MKYFKHLHVPEHWEHYWTKYPEGYTILEALINWVSQVDSMVDSQNKLNDIIVDFRKELEEFISEFDINLQEKVINILHEWQEDGTLEIIIDEALQTQIDTKVEKGEIFINVVDYGAVADAHYRNESDGRWYVDSKYTQLATDNKQAFEAAIADIGRYGVIFVPSSAKGANYRLTSLTIPTGKDGISMNGAGKRQTSLVFEDKNAISVHAEMFQVQDISLTGTGIYTSNSCVFRDSRTSNTADFDITIDRCKISDVETVVNARGRGVFINNTDFHRVRYEIIKMDFPEPTLFVPGEADEQRYDTGFRAVSFKNNRVHYAPSSILTNLGLNKENLTGVQIIGNYLEGSTSYINGYVKDAIIDANLQYFSGAVRSALFMFQGCDNVTINIKASGMKGTTPKQFNSLIRSTAPCNNLTVNANIQDMNQHAILLFGGRNISINLNASNIGKEDDSLYAFVRLHGTGDTIYDGLYIGGVVESDNQLRHIIRRSGGITVRNVIIDLAVRGTYETLHNLPPSTKINRELVKDTYIGTTDDYIVKVGYPPKAVQVMYELEGENKLFNRIYSSAINNDIIELTDDSIIFKGELAREGYRYFYEYQ